MKITIESYTGPNTVVTTGKDVVKLPVNTAHPAVGESLEIQDSWVTRKATKEELDAAHAAKVESEAKTKADEKAKADAEKADKKK